MNLSEQAKETGGGMQRITWDRFKIVHYYEHGTIEDDNRYPNFYLGRYQGSGYARKDGKKLTKWDQKFLGSTLR